jgi:hypothetical protein
MKPLEEFKPVPCLDHLVALGTQDFAIELSLTEVVFDDEHARRQSTVTGRWDQGQDRPSR